MKLKTLIPFVVVLAILGGLIVLRMSQRQDVTMREQIGIEALTPEDLSADSIDRIELYAGPSPEEKVELSRGDDGWIVASHYDAPVKEDVIDGFLDKLTDIKGEPRATADDEEELATYNLKDDEAFYVRAFTGDGDEPVVELLFGKAPNFNSVFVRRAGENQVYLEANDLRREAGVNGDDMSIEPQPGKWLDKEVLALPKEEITRLALTLPDRSITLEKREIPAEAPEAPAEGEGAAPAPPAEPEFEWVAAEGGLPDAELKETGVDRILGRLAALNASDVADPAQKAEYGLEDPQFKLVVSRSEGDDVTLLGGRQDSSGSGYVMLADADKEIVYELSQFNFEYVFLKAGDLYDLPQLDFTKAGMNRIELTHADGGRAVVVKDDNEWIAAAPTAGVEVKTTAIDEMLNAIAGLRMQDYTEEPLGEVQHAITIEEGASSRTIQTGGKSPVVDGYYVTLSGDPKTYVINTVQYEKIFIRPGELFELSALSFDQDDFTGMRMRMDGKEVALDKRGETWMVSVDGGATYEAEEGRLNRMLEALDGLVFSGFSDASAADWEPFITMSIRGQDGASHLINVGPAEGDVHTVKWDGQDQLYTFTTDTANLLQYHFNTIQYTPDPAPETAEEAPTAEEGTEEPDGDAGAALGAVAEEAQEAAEVVEEVMEETAETAEAVAEEIGEAAEEAAESADLDTAPPEAGSALKTAPEEEAAPTSEEAPAPEEAPTAEPASAEESPAPAPEEAPAQDAAPAEEAAPAEDSTPTEEQTAEEEAPAESSAEPAEAADTPVEEVVTE